MERCGRSFRVFLVIWSGQLLSRVGSGISAFALGVHLYQKTGSCSSYSLLLLAACLPSVLLAPVGGVIADRRDRKLMMAVGDLGSSLGILFVIVMLLSYPDQEWPIYLGVTLSSLFIALHSPAFKASVTDLVEEKAYAKASGLIQLAEASRHLLAPVIAAFLLQRLSLPLVLVIDVATFVAAALTVVVIRKEALPRQDKEGEFWKELQAGARYLAGNRVVLQLLGITVVLTFLTGMLQALFTPMVLSFADSATLGAIQSIAAFGMLASSACIGLTSGTCTQGKPLTVSLFAAGLSYLLIGTSTDALAMTGTVFCFFVTLPFVNASLEVLFRRRIDQEMQGRAWSLISLISQSGMLMAFAVAGVLADRFFNPLLTQDGCLSDSLGRGIGAGTARGGWLMVMIGGAALLLHTLYAADPAGIARRIQRPRQQW